MTLREKEEFQRLYGQIRATREGGRVVRCHVLPAPGGYNIGQHSFGAVSLLLLLNPSPSIELVWAVQFHDIAERWLGDVPSTAKGAFPELRKVYEQAEKDVMTGLGLHVDLGWEETNWLFAVDTLELYLWCKEEYAQGNTNVEGWLISLRQALETRHQAGKLPAEVWDFFRKSAHLPMARLPDRFDQIDWIDRDELIVG